MIDQLKTRLKSYRQTTFNVDLPKAAILVPVTRNDDNPHIILTRRTQHLKTHKGQVAFPGGKYEPNDPSLQHTALRECQEEIGLDPQKVEILGTLSHVISVHGIIVTPFVGLVDENVELTPNLDELDSIFTVPARYFSQAQPKRRDRMSFENVELSVPSYEYQYNQQNYEIWGLSSIILTELVNVAFDYNIQLLHK